MKRSIKILSFIFIFFCLFCIKSNAFEINFGNTPAQVSPGESFTVEISTSVKSYLSNGHIKYDSNLFTYEGVEGQPNMSANIYSNDGDLAWMYTEISNAPVGTDLLKFKFKAKKVTQTSSGDFVITGIDDEEGAKFITNKEYTYSGNEIGGRKKQTVTIYVPDSLVVSPKNIELIVGDSQVISVNKKGSRFESRDENIATVDQNGNVTGINVGSTVITVTDKDGMTAEIIVTVKNKQTLKNIDNSTVNKVLPQTGSDWFKTIVILAFVVFAMILFIRYKRYKKLFIILFLMGTVLIPNFVEAFTNVDSTKIKAGIFRNLDGVDNVVAISPNNSFKYGQSLTKNEIEEKDAIFEKNNLGVKSVKDNNDKILSDEEHLATGYKIQSYVLGYEDEITEYNLVLYGDADGNATFCDNDDINVIKNDYVYKKKATGVYKIAANLYAYDDILDVSDIQRMILKRYDNLKALIGKDGTDGKSDSTLVNPFPEAGNSITLEPNKIKIDVGDFKDIKASGQKGELTWTSRDPEIATVDENGKITGAKKGNTIITATDSEGNSATVYVIVKNPATSVIIDPNTWITELDNHETKKLKYTLIPDTTPLPDAKITWSSSNEKIATVSEEGVVTPVAVGKVDIIVTAHVSAEDTADGVQKTLTDVCKVMINQSPSENDSYVTPTDVTLNLSNKYNEKTKNLTIYLSPEYSNSTIEWRIQDGRKEVKFTDTTDITAKTVTIEGVNVTTNDLKVTVTVTNQNETLPGFTKSVTVRVINSASEIKEIKGLDPSKVDDKNKNDKVIDGTIYPIVDGTLILPNDTTYYMEVEYNPESATSEVKWNSDKEDIATVSSNNKKIGKITTSKDKQGVTNIKAITTDKNIESLPVKVYVSKIDLNGTGSVEAGLDIKDISATVYPLDLKNNKIKWESDKPNIATVDNNGIVKGITPGTATITATLLDNNGNLTPIKATKTINVRTSLVINNDKIIIPVNGTETISTNIDGNTGLSFSSSNPNIATVNSSGVVTGKATGTTKITVKYENGESREVLVTVIVGSLTLTDTTVTVGNTAEIPRTVQPSALSVYGIEWSSNNTAVATVGASTGLVKGIKEGTAIITAKISGTSIYKTCTVTVVDDLVISDDEMVVANGNSRNIKFNYSGDVNNLIATSSNTNYCDVAINGQNIVVTGKSNGEATVTIKNKNTNKQDTIKIIVMDFSFSKIEEIVPGQMIAVQTISLPSTLTGGVFSYKSLNTDIATISSGGLITAKSVGKATIEATLTKDGQSVTHSNELTVVNGTTTITGPYGDNLTNGKIDTVVGHTPINLKAESSSSAAKFTWSSNNNKVATIDSNGSVKIVGPGQATISLKNTVGDTVTVDVNVIGMSVSNARALYYPGKTDTGEHPRKQTLSVILTSNPSITDNKITFKWSTEDRDKVIVNNGNLTAVGIGNTNVICKGTLSGEYGGDITVETLIEIISDAVAQIVTTTNGITKIVPYAELNTAFSESSSDDTIQLVDNIDSTVKFGNVSQIAVNKNIIFDLNGYNIIVGGTSNAFDVTNSATMKIKNSKNSGGVNINKTFLKGYYNSIVILENVNIETKGGYEALYMTDTAKLQLKSGKISNSSDADGTIIMNGSSKAVITGGTISGTKHAICNNGDGTIQIYIDNDNKQSINISSTNVEEATIYTNGNIKIGNNSDEKIYAATKNIQLEDFEDNRPELYIGGGNYGIQIIVKESASKASKIYWYNGELEGISSSIMVNTPDSNGNIIENRNFELYFNDKYINGNGNNYWGIPKESNENGTLQYFKFEGLNGEFEQILMSTPKDLYYGNREHLYGDVNLDGSVSLSDLMALNKIIAGNSYSEAQLKNADLNNDNKLNEIDKNILQQFLIGAIKKIPVNTDESSIIISETLCTASVDEPFNAYVIKEIPFEVTSYNGTSISDILKIKTGNDSEDITLVKGVDYDYINNFFVLKKDIEELKSEYNLTSFKYIYNAAIDQKFIMSINSASSTVKYDFNGNGRLDYGDYALLKKHYEGKIDLNNYEYCKNKLVEFETYVSSKGLSADNKNDCLYLLRKDILLSFVK